MPTKARGKYYGDAIWVTMRFNDLPRGSVFEFDHTGLPLCSGIARGPWVKLSARRYRLAGEPTGHVHQVGTVSVLVEPLRLTEQEYVESSF